jgi:predicted methyltransferase
MATRHVAAAVHRALLLESAAVTEGGTPMTSRLCSFSSALAVVLLASTSGAQAADAVPADVSAAVADAARPAADKERDAARKPAESVAFAGIKKGDKVVDVMPGRGYFTRIFSKVVGDKGVVYAAPPARRPDAPAGAPDPAAGSTALAAEYKNIKVIPGSLPNLTVPEPVDVVWTSLNYHDIRNQPNDNYVAFNKAVFAALKPGGVFMVVDHAAAPGSGTRDTQTLHRIDPEAVKKDVTAAGFKFDGEGSFLKNDKDPHTARVHDETVRGQTDQFILKFVKPKS